MAPAISSSARDRVGPHPSYIEVAKPYILQSRIQRCLAEMHMSDAKEDAVRLQGVAWIDQVRRALQLPIRTFNTAVIYYHKFRLLHADNEYNWADAAAAALFTACKIEDTLKKSREILCAHWNLKVGPGDGLSSDDPRFENHSKLIIGLERLMLESAGFDFRNRYPQKVMVKLARALKFDLNKEAKTAWNLSIDLYRTFAPLKQTSPTLAIACLELAGRLHGIDTSRFADAGIIKYSKWATSRAEVMETLLDLLDLYTHHRSSTSVGPSYTLEHFINIRIGLNQEASAANISRYALYVSESASDAESTTNGIKLRSSIDPTSPVTPATPATLSPGTNKPPKSAIGVRGQDGTVRFMLDAARARDERAEVDRFHKVEQEEYEVEVPIDNRTDDRDKDRPRAGRGLKSYANSAKDLVVDSDHKIQMTDTDPEGGYWEKLRKRQEEAKRGDQISEDVDFVHPSRQVANFDYSSDKASKQEKDGYKVDNHEDAALAWVTRQSKRGNRSKDGFRGRTRAQGERRGGGYVCLPSSGDDRDQDVSRSSFGIRKRGRSDSRSPILAHRRSKSWRHEVDAPARSDTLRTIPSNQAETPELCNYIHPDRLGFLSPGSGAAGDQQRPASVQHNHNTASHIAKYGHISHQSSSQPIRADVVLSAEDGHQWAKEGNDRGKGKYRDRSHSQSRVRGRVSGEKHPSFSTGPKYEKDS